MDNFYAMLVDYEGKSCPGKILGLFSTEMMNPKNELFHSVDMNKEIFQINQEKIYLNLWKKQNVNFDYYSDSSSHIFSKECWSLISKYKIAPHISIPLTVAISDQAIAEEKSYKLFVFEKKQFFDEQTSIFQIGEMGTILPSKINFTDTKYDLFQLNDTILHNVLIVSIELMDVLKTANLDGYKFVSLDNLLDTFMNDHHLDISDFIKPKHRKLP
ncbi:immunity 43 family protein [Neisseria sp. Dent CA1/247]|uniref:Immunity protein 43 domain-containing protein n=3 Tax=Neisseria zoodegmatis TaxID=326523 RepID=A0AB38DSR2_9NEIS|nr:MULTISPECIES: Imm43 family immunity protein [Neisseria]UOO76129.1 immunity 43 family protein [Neisseria sp. Dent CA1/247]SNU80261.1 Uncharacterised protein [Neisseria zoodegmatis]